MGRQRGSQLGIELQENEIRVVEIRCGSSKPTVLKVGSTPMPAGALLKNGVINRPAEVAIALQRVISSLRPSTSEAVFGISTYGTKTRSLTVPEVNEPELRSLVDGEVRFYQIFQSEQAAYDYFPLKRGVDGKLPENSLVLMGIEEQVAVSLSEVAAKAGLEIVALEPVPVGLFRASHTSLEKTPSTLFISLTENATEIGIAEHGTLCLYRRVDVGTNELLDAEVGSMAFDDQGNAIEDPLIKKSKTGLPVDTLSVEMRRSLDFYKREFSNAPTVERFVITSNHPGAGQLVELFTSALEMPGEAFQPAEHLMLNPSEKLEMDGRAGSRYTAALGLALHGCPDTPKSIPELDLFVQERSVVEYQAERSKLTFALIASMVIIALGLMGGYIFGMQANRNDHEIEHLQTEVDSLKKQEQAALSEQVKRMEQAQTLSKEGIPIYILAGQLANSLDSGTGLVTLDFDYSGQIRLAGEASNEGSVIRSVQNLQGYPAYRNLAISSFEKIDQNGSKEAVKFSLTTPVQTAGAQ